MKAWRSIESIVAQFVLAILLMGLIFSVPMAVMAAIHGLPVQAAPLAYPETCDHVATADTIKIYFCEDIDLFVNQLGFMVFEP